MLYIGCPFCNYNAIGQMSLKNHILSTHSRMKGEEAINVNILYYTLLTRVYEGGGGTGCTCHSCGEILFFIFIVINIFHT